MPSETKQVPTKALRFGVDVQVGSNGENAKTAPITITARSGEPIEHWFWGRIVHDLAGMRLSKPKIPLDYCHDEESVIGYANHFDVSTGDLVAGGALVPYSVDPEDKASEVIYKSQAGIPYEGSIFFDNPMSIENVPDGMSVQVNGRTFVGPLAVVRQWTLRGIAVCPYGADANTEAEVEMSAGRTVAVNVFHTETKQMSTQTVEAPAVEAAAIEDTKPVEVAATEAEAPAVEVVAEVSEAAPEVPAQSEGQKFLSAFGPKGGVWFAEGKTFSEAQSLFNSEVVAERDALAAKCSDLEKKLSASRGEASPVSFQTEEVKPSAEQTKLATNLGPNLGKFAAGITIRRAGDKK